MYCEEKAPLGLTEMNLVGCLCTWKVLECSQTWVWMLMDASQYMLHMA